MKPATMAPTTWHMYPRLAHAAQRMGYALAVHGSLSRDIDLVAVPWIEDAAPAEALVAALAEECGGSVATEHIDSAGGPAMPLPKHRPHGRLGYLIFLRWSAGYLDVSVMPRAPSEHGGGDEGQAPGKERG